MIETKDNKVIAELEIERVIKMLESRYTLIEDYPSYYRDRVLTAIQQCRELQANVSMDLISVPR